MIDPAKAMERRTPAREAAGTHQSRAQDQIKSRQN
jgi:hypothetical protein